MRTSELIKILEITQNAQLSHIESPVICNASARVKNFVNKRINDLLSKDITSEIIEQKYDSTWYFNKRDDESPWPDNHFLNKKNKKGFVFCPDEENGPQIAFTKSQYLTNDGLAPDAEFSPVPYKKQTEGTLKLVEQWKNERIKEPKTPDEVYEWNRRTENIIDEGQEYDPRGSYIIRGQWYFFKNYEHHRENQDTWVTKVPSWSKFLYPLRHKTDRWYSHCSDMLHLTTSGPGFMGSTENRDHDFVEEMRKDNEVYTYANTSMYFHNQLEYDLGFDIPIALKGHLLNTDQQTCYVYNPTDNNKLIEKETVIVRVNNNAPGCIRIGDQEQFFVMYKDDLDSLHKDLNECNNPNRSKSSLLQKDCLGPYTEDTLICPNL